MAEQSLDSFFEAVRHFAKDFSSRTHNSLRGVTDGKAVGTYIEHEFQTFLIDTKTIGPEDLGSSAKGIDLPRLNIDIKVTSIKQPQSSSPFRSFKQKIEGLGYSLVLFVYKKTDTAAECFLPLVAVRFIPAHRTADFQTTRGILDIIKNDGNEDDIFAFLTERMVPVDETALMEYAESLLKNPPQVGYLTISNALQWRLQYRRVITSDLDDIANLDPISHGDLSPLITGESVETPLVED